MSGNIHQSIAESHPFEVADGIDNKLVDEIWHELDKQLPRVRVRCVVSEIALRFQDATVKTFLPILVHRCAVEQLRQELNNMASADRHLLDEQQ